METLKTDTLDCFFKTENEHWNSFAYALYCKVIEKDLFTDPRLPLQLIDSGIDIIVEHYENPAIGVQLFLNEVAKVDLNAMQQIFVYEGVNTYLSQTEFDGKEPTSAHDILGSHIKHLRKISLPVKPLVKDIRETLKQLVHKELETLPETLKDLEPEKRLNIVCKLIPFVLPKVETVHSESGEPSIWS